MHTIGIIGIGYWGKNVIRTFNNISNCRVKTVSDLKFGRRKYVKENYADIQVVEDHREIINDDEIDAVIIVTPPESHHKIGLEVLNAGKHLFVEKPLTTNSEDAKELIMSKEKDLRLLVGHLFIFHPAIIAVKEFLDSGKLGNVLYIETSRGNARPPTTRSNVVWDLAPHDFSTIFHLLGKLPISVTGYGRDFTGKGVEDVAHIRFDFEDSVFSTVHVGWHTSLKSRRMTIYCEKGVISYNFDKSEDKVTIYEEGVDTRLNTGDNESHDLVYSPGKEWHPILDDFQPLTRECDYFLNSLNGGNSDLSNGVKGYNVVRAIEIAVESIKQNGVRLQF